MLEVMLIGMGQNHARDPFDNVMVVAVVFSCQETSSDTFNLVVWA